MTTAPTAAEPTAEPEREPEDTEQHEPEQDTEHEEQHEPEREPEPAEPEPAALSEKQLNAAFDRLAKEGRRHRDRLSEIMGEESLLLEPCPLCTPELAGWRFPVEPDEETKQAVRAVLGDALDGHYETADYVRQCAACKGLGQVLTGSLVPDRRTIACRRCLGFGFEQEDAPATVQPAAVPAGNGAAEWTPPGEPPADVDFMGRRRDDPNFGRLAGYEV